VLGTVALAGGGFIAEAKRLPGVEVLSLAEEPGSATRGDLGAARSTAGMGGRDA